MAINQEYFGSQETWATATTESLNQQFEFKVANWNPNDSTIGKGDYKYKFGQLFNETGEYVINLDISTAYCAMDSNAPFVHRLYTSARYDSTHYHSRIDLAPETDTPIGWYAGSIPTYMVILPEGYATDLAPVNFKPLWEDPAWHPTIGTSNGQRTLGYIGSANSPVLSFPFKNIKLVPVVKCCAFKSGKTKADLENITTSTDFASVVDLPTEKFVPLGTYLNDSYSGTPFYEAFPVICSLYVAPVLLYFDNDGNLAIPPSCRSKYNSTAMRSYGNMREALHVDIFPTDKVNFTELISRYGTAYEDASCEAKLFPTDKMPVDYIYYNYNGNSYPQKSLTVYGQGAFCIGGRCAGSAGNYNFMYVRVIDPDTFKIYADTDDADIACGVLVDDFGTLDDFRDYVRKSVAYFGMFFTDDIEPAVEETSSMDTQGLFLGIVDENGITHGTYSEGTENRDQTNYDWEDPVDDTPWTPGGGGGGDEDSDNDDARTQLPTGWDSSLYNDFYNMYYLGPGFTYALYQAIERLVNPTFWQSLMEDKIFTPQQYVISCHTMPSKLVPPVSSLMERIACGATTLTDAGVIAPRFASSYKFYTVGEIDVNEALNDFNDYGLTNIYIHLPYIGFKQLDTEAVMGGKLNVSYIADVISGDCVATVWVRDRNGNSKNRYEWKGNCARPMNLTTITEPWSSAAGLIGGMVSRAAPMIITGLSGGLNFAAGAMAYSSINRLANSTGISQVNGWNTGQMVEAFRTKGIALPGDSLRNVAIGLGSQKGVGSIGSIFNTSAGATASNNASGGNVSVQTETKCYLLIVRPQESRPNSYKDLFGLPSDKAGKVKDFSGFLSIRETKLDGIEATEDEKAQIVQLLMSGIYLN